MVITYNSYNFFLFHSFLYKSNAMFYCNSICILFLYVRGNIISKEARVLTLSRIMCVERKSNAYTYIDMNIQFQLKNKIRLGSK